MNRIILTGGLTKDAELREGPRGSVVSFRFAVRDFSKKKDDGTYESMYFNVTAFGAVADRFFKNARKGVQILVDGRVRQNSYTKSGVTVTTTEIVADNIELIGAKAANDSASAASSDDQSGYVQDAEPVQANESKNLDQVDVATDDLPF